MTYVFAVIIVAEKSFFFLPSTNGDYIIDKWVILMAFENKTISIWKFCNSSHC